MAFALSFYQKINQFALKNAGIEIQSMYKFYIYFHKTHSYSLFHPVICKEELGPIKYFFEMS